MALTEFGKVVRKARIDVDATLRSMSAELETSPSFLSGLETGSKKISKDWVAKIKDFFSGKGLELLNLDSLAAVSNETVCLTGLNDQHKMLVAGFASSHLTAEQLKKIGEIIDKMESENMVVENG